MATATTRLTFSQFIDLLLARLYDAELQGDGGFTDLNALARELKMQFPRDWVIDAAQVMQARGLADCLITFGGCEARLTGQGRLFVEQPKSPGIIEEYRKDPAEFVRQVNVTGNGNNVIIATHAGGTTQTSTIEQERQPAFQLLGEIQDRLDHDDSLGKSERQDLLSDIESLRAQLHKREPNRHVLAALLTSFSQIASIAGLVATLD
jgi:hypothetical protein